MTAKRVVYTSLIGEYEELNEQPQAASSAIDFVCFTDNPELKSETWEIRVVDPRFPRDSVRSQRYFKMIGPELLSEYDESLYIDNSILLTTLPERLFEEWFTSNDLSLPLHSFRDTVAAEFDEVDLNGLDDPTRIHEQFISYSVMLPSVLNEKPFWAAIMLRRHTIAVFKTMRLWYENILRYSRRDQLSINYAILVSGLKTTALEIDNHSSEFHTWPNIRGRKHNIRNFNLSDILYTSKAEIGRIENKLGKLNQVISDRDRQIDALKYELTENRDRQIDALKFELTETRIRLQGIEQSRSWRMTAPYRWFGGFIKRIERRYSKLRATIKAEWSGINLKNINKVKSAFDYEIGSNNLFQDALIHFYKKVPATIIQIGACDGRINDPIYQLVRNQIQSNTIVLIEPQPELIDILKENYAFHKDVRIENVAIGEPGDLILYRLKQEYWSKFERTYLKDAPTYRVPSGFVSSNYQHVLKHIEGKLPKETLIAETIEELKVPSKQLKEILESHNIKKIDILQIDVEGHDDTVLYHSNIDKYKPKIIHFEHMHLKTQNKHTLYKFLEKQGYNVCEYSSSDTMATREK
jgi:FkbM family methyltransferase